MNQIYPNFGEPNFLGVLRFELKSLFGRHFKKHLGKIKPKNTPLLIDIGAGVQDNYTEGWIHIDFYTIRMYWLIVNLWKKVPQRLPEVETDFRYPLNCSSNIVDGAYSGHTLEHLYPKHAYQLIGEIFRVLKPHSWLRINIPDLQRAIDIYNEKITAPEFKYKAEAISDLTQNWGHHSVWDEEILTAALENAGFVNVRKVEFGQEGTDKRLILEKEERRIGTLVIEAQKP